MNEARPATLDVKRWVIDVISWDGLWPLAIFSVSIGLTAAFRGNSAVETTMLIALPVIGVLVRFAIGSKRISSNHCERKTRVVQFVCLVVALLLYMFFDFFVVLAAIVPDKHVLTPEDVIALSCFGIVYVLLAAVAMYPGRISVAQLPNVTPGTWPVVLEWCNHGGEGVLLVKCIPTNQLIAYCPHCCGAWMSPDDISPTANNFVNPIYVAQGFRYPSQEDLFASEWHGLIIGSTDEWSLDELNDDLQRLAAKNEDTDP